MKRWWGRKLSEARKMMSGLKSVKKILKGPIDPRMHRFRSRMRPRQPPNWVPTKVEMIDPWRLLLKMVSNQSRRMALGTKHLQLADLLPPPVEYDNLDDLPFQARLWQERKRQREEEASGEEQLKRLRTTEFANYVLTS